MPQIEQRFKNLVAKFGQIITMVNEFTGENAPDFISMSLKANLTIDSKKYTMIISPSDADFIEGHDPYTRLFITASEQFWHDVFDGKLTFFGGYTQNRVQIPNYRTNRFSIFYISGMISMLQHLKMKI
ncbi:MAG: hypothetical protein ACTSRS_18810 [Candidatus Helarchaeota archaeon]